MPESPDQQTTKGRRIFFLFIKKLMFFFIWFLDCILTTATTTRFHRQPFDKHREDDDGVPWGWGARDVSIPPPPVCFLFLPFLNLLTINYKQITYDNNNNAITTATQHPTNSRPFGPTTAQTGQQETRGLETHSCVSSHSIFCLGLFSFLTTMGNDGHWQGWPEWCSWGYLSYSVLLVPCNYKK